MENAEVKRKKAKDLKKMKLKKIKGIEKSIKKQKSELEHRQDYLDYSKKQATVSSNFNSHMHRHTITWIIALVIFLVFVSTALLFIMRTIK